MIYTMKNGDVDYTCTQISTLHNGDIVTLNFYVPTEALDTCEGFVEKTLNAFVLCEKQENLGDDVVDDKTPDGMKIASHDDIEYRLYVPKSWICKSDSGKSEAYYPESARSNVTLTSYSPSDVITLEEYISNSKSR